jgi:HD-GYP domain-containing protein (c-di-GMP phosphodiesterase class II)
MQADYQDILASLNRALPLREKLMYTHRTVQALLPFVTRIAVVLYDSKTALLKTYVHSSGEQDPLSNYQVPLSNAPSLAALMKEGRPRVINNMQGFELGAHEHTRRIGRQGYAASYTLPMFSNGAFFGFIFFNSYEAEVFTTPALHQLDVFGHMISLMVINELSAARTLVAAVTTISNLTHVRDPETGSHLDRISRYARLIAMRLAPRHALDDEFIEHIFLYSPLHDIGKIGIPDHILLKPGRLTDEEMSLMRTHTLRGREIVDNLVANFGLHEVWHIDILRNIVELHHENMNGKGYPRGLKGTEIPLEARIVAVADVFDALTSPRPYKEAWSNDAAFATLRQLAGDKLDPECVAVLTENRAEVEDIQLKFKESLLD